MIFYWPEMFRTTKLIILVSSILISACTGESTSKEEQVEQFIATVKEAAEKRDFRKLPPMIHKNYADHKGLDKQRLVQLVSGHLFTHKNIYLLTNIKQMIFHTDNKVAVTLFMAMAGNVILDVNSLSSLRAHVYEIELHLVKEDEWLLQLADWKRSTVKDMVSSFQTQVEER